MLGEQARRTGGGLGARLRRSFAEAAGLLTLAGAAAAQPAGIRAQDVDLAERPPDLEEQQRIHEAAPVQRGESLARHVTGLPGREQGSEGAAAAPAPAHGRAKPWSSRGVARGRR